MPAPKTDGCLVRVLRGYRLMLMMYVTAILLTVYTVLFHPFYEMYRSFRIHTTTYWILRVGVTNGVNYVPKEDKERGPLMSVGHQGWLFICKTKESAERAHAEVSQAGWTVDGPPSEEKGWYEWRL